MGFAFATTVVLRRYVWEENSSVNMCRTNGASEAHTCLRETRTSKKKHKNHRKAENISQPPGNERLNENKGQAFFL